MKIAIAQADKPNLVGNIYTRESIEKMKSCIDEAMKSGFCGGEIMHEDYQYQVKNSLDLSRVTHQIKGVEITDDFLVVSVEFMNTSEGKSARFIVESAMGIIRPTIAGNLDPVTKEVKIEKVMSIDIVQYHEDFLNVSWKKIK
jgi:hypothetical protein